MTWKVKSKPNNASIIIEVYNDDIQCSSNTINSKNTTNTNTTNNDNKMKMVKILVTGDSIPLGVHEKGLSQAYRVKIKNYLGATNDNILDKVYSLLKSKPDCLLVHVRANNITNKLKLLNCVKKIVKKVNNSSPNKKVAFSSVIVHKDGKHVPKKGWWKLRNYCHQKL